MLTWNVSYRTAFSFSKEFAYLHDKTASTLARYYESRNHSKKQLQAGGFSDVIRGIQAKTHINIGPDLEGYSGEVIGALGYSSP